MSSGVLRVSKGGLLGYLVPSLAVAAAATSLGVDGSTLKANREKALKSLTKYLGHKRKGFTRSVTELPDRSRNTTDDTLSRSTVSFFGLSRVESHAPVVSRSIGAQDHINTLADVEGERIDVDWIDVLSVCSQDQHLDIAALAILDGDRPSCVIIKRSKRRKSNES